MVKYAVSMYLCDCVLTDLTNKQQEFYQIKSPQKFYVSVRSKWNFWSSESRIFCTL